MDLVWDADGIDGPTLSRSRLNLSLLGFGTEPTQQVRTLLAQVFDQAFELLVGLSTILKMVDATQHGNDGIFV